MNELINKQAAIAMAEKIVEEVEQLTVDIEEKKVWSRELMNSVLPSNSPDNDNLTVSAVWPVSTEVISDGGIGINWDSNRGWGQLELYWGDDGMLHADTEYMGLEFVRRVLSMLADKVIIDE